MDVVERREDGPDAITIARCRELLGDEAVTLSDHEIARIRGHAETMAHLVVEIFAANRRNPAYPTVSTARVLREATVGSMLPLMVGAVIYVRVSTKEQTENLSLPTQLRACEEYCRRQGYDVLARFHEEGESAKTTDRSQLQALLKYCRTHKGQVHFVVVYNLTRFAREKYDHFALRAHLKSLGISLRSATEPIDDTSTGKLMEGVLAAFAQFDNDCRSDRTRAGMRAALELGPLDVPGAARLSECPEGRRHEPGARPGARPARAACVRRTGVGAIHQARDHRPRDRGRAAQPPRTDALAAELRADDAERRSTSARSRARTSACPRWATSSRSWTRPRSTARRPCSTAASP